VVNGVRSGAISLDEACRRYQLSADEFLAWQGAIEAHGIGASPGPSITTTLPRTSEGVAAGLVDRYAATPLG
jgi:hypothetical protein